MTNENKAKEIGEHGRRTSFEKQQSYQKKQRRHRQMAHRRRAFFFITLALVSTALILLLSPLLNVRSVTVDGNNTVSSEEIVNTVSGLTGENLFRTGSGQIKDMITAIPYIKDATIKKQLFPPLIHIYVTEYSPAAVLRAEGINVTVSSDLKVLEETSYSPDDIPKITGVLAKDFHAGEYITLEETEKQQTLEAMLSELQSTGLLNNTIEINVNSLSGITMNYDDRISVYLGSDIDMTQKIRMLGEIIKSDHITSNAQGTIDLSNAKKAIYTP